MTAMADVVNTSLRLLGSTRITSLTDGSVPANIANDIIDDLIDDLLRQHAWNFATKREKLAQATATPAFEFDHAYAVPSDWIRTVAVHGDSGAYTRIVYREEVVESARVIVTSSDEAWMQYVARITDPNLWSADFRRAVSTSLARDMAMALANSYKLMVALDEKSRSDLARARSTDALGSIPEQRPRGSWITSRFGMRGPRPGNAGE